MNLKGATESLMTARQSWLNLSRAQGLLLKKSKKNKIRKMSATLEGHKGFHGTLYLSQLQLPQRQSLVNPEHPLQPSIIIWGRKTHQPESPSLTRGCEGQCAAETDGKWGYLFISRAQNSYSLNGTFKLFGSHSFLPDWWLRGMDWEGEAVLLLIGIRGVIPSPLFQALTLISHHQYHLRPPQSVPLHH